MAASSAALPLDSASPLPAEADVVVVGAGVVGCTLALELAKNGVAVAVIDRGDVNALASGQNAGSLHVQISSVRARNPDPEFVRTLDGLHRLLHAGIGVWQEIARSVDTDVEMEIQGGLMVAETEEDRRFLVHKIERERRLGLECHLLEGAELRAVAPYLSEHILAADYCANEGKINPTLATPAIARAARRAGAEFHANAELQAIERTNHGFMLTTARGRIRCGRVVNAAGAYGVRVAAMVGMDLPTAPEPLHMNASEPGPRLVRHLIQHASRRLTMKQASNGNLLIGGGWPAKLDGLGRLPGNLADSIRGNLWVATRVAPAVARFRLLRCWAGLNIGLAAQAALGEAPGAPGFFNVINTVAGYTAGPIIGRLGAELVQGRAPSHDISMLAPAARARTPA